MICLVIGLFCHGSCCRVIWSCFFFFKQKTAYEMRISDWSSDVCSSDLTKNVKQVVGVKHDRDTIVRTVLNESVGDDVAGHLELVGIASKAAGGAVEDRKSVV